MVPAAALAGLEAQYAYLEASLKRFATGAQQESRAMNAGFRSAKHRPLMAGQMGMLLLQN